VHRSRVSALPRVGGLFGLCLVIALAAAAGVDSPRAQDGDAWTPAFGDSAAQAESLRIADSIAVADSIAFEEAAAQAAAEEAAATFGNARSILDKTRPPGFLTYNTSYQVNRGNRTWTQNTDFYVAPGPAQVANTTSITIGREDRVGRLNKNRSTRTELAYRVTPFLRLGGALGLQRQDDDARNRSNFTALRLENNDASAQARFNRNFGEFPVRALLSYGFLDNTQAEQRSEGSTVGLFASTSRDFGLGNRVSLDASQQFSRLRSTVEDDASYVQDDRNESRDIRFTGAATVNQWVSADARLSSQRSRVERPARIIIEPPPDDFESEPDTLTVPESVLGVNDNVDAAVHFRLPGSALVNLSGNLGRNEQVYQAELERTTIASVESFRADFTKPFAGLNPSITYENSRSETDLTKKDPGWVEASLTRKLDLSAGRVLSPRLSSRLTGSIVLTRRRYVDFRTGIPFVTPPTDSDNRRMRGSLRLDYKAGTNFDTGVTAGIEQNDVVNLAGTSSINNARLRTYSVTWNWVARPGSSWLVTQSNSATAAQQYYTFSPERDQLSFIYNLTTVVGSQLTSKARLEMTNVLRLQSRGTWRLVENSRRFGKASEFNTLDLALRTIYNATDWLGFEAQQRLSVSPNSTVQRGISVKTSDSRRTEFTAIARVNYPFSGSANLTADVRRTLATDRNRTFGTAFSDRATNNDYWLASVSLRKTFGAGGSR
jgi:hypothetical protein